MSKTLFWYLFRDLLKVFVLATLVLAGIMSFGGLLRPLTRYGLDLWQVLQMVAYLMPAMMTYSIPIASLFATTIVYGRLSADNELTACRAAGLSYFSMSLPALAMGLIISIGSLLFLSYVVPYYSLSVQRVIFANVARYIENDIERSHELSLVRGGTKIYAQGAYVPPVQDPQVQTVILEGPTIISEDRTQPGVAATFSMARMATLRITQGAGDQMLFDATLDGGVTFSRQGLDRPQAGVELSRVGPIPVPSLIQENVKFMNIERLKTQAAAPETAQRVRKAMAMFIAAEQEDVYLRGIRARLVADGKVVLVSGAETYELQSAGAGIQQTPDRLVISATTARPLRVLRRQADGQVDLLAEARGATLRARAENENSRVLLLVDLEHAHLVIRGDAFDREAYPLPPVVVPMSSDLQALRQRVPRDYLGANYRPDKRNELQRNVIRAQNDAIAEMHSRTSFSLSCLVLVIMGCCMGMVFRSGDFLTAFAVSVVPALVTITLVVAGQQFAADVPDNVSAGFRNPLPFALSLIWAGNAIVGIIALGVMRRLHRH